MRSRLILLKWLLSGVFRAQPGRWVMATMTVALGLGLAVAIDAVNRSALGSFGRAIDVINGQASAQLVAPAGDIADEVFDQIHRRRSEFGIAAVSPVLSLATDPVPLLGLDLFRSAAVTPSLLPQVAPAARDDLFAADTVFLSAAALKSIGLSVGQSMIIRLGGRDHSLRIAGTLPGVSGEPLAVMDLGAVQWRFDRVGRLSRLDLRLEEGARNDAVAEDLQRVFPGLKFVSADDRTRRMSNLSRAYRVNLSMLALVALLTGGFLVFTAVSLSVLRQQSQLALLEVVGAGPRFVAGLVLAQGGVIGAIGGALGLMLGLGLAAGLIAFVGGDLGAGYFSSMVGRLEIHPVALLLFWSLAVAVGIFAALGPALSSRQTPPVVRLRTGASDRIPRALARPWTAVALALVAVLLLFVPAVDGLPLAAYLAIAMLLMSGVAATPWVIRTASRLLHHAVVRSGVHSTAPTTLAAWRLSQASASAAGIVSGTVAAVSLTVAMMVMVASFRDSVSRWLDQILPADLYASTLNRPGGAAFPPDLGERVRSIPGVVRVELQVQQSVLIRPDRPEVLLMARVLSASDPAREVPLTGPMVPVPGSGPIVFVSESMADLYGWRPGQSHSLVLGSSSVELRVLGVFRDYGRQHGSIIMDMDDYGRLTGDRRRTALGVWLTPLARPDVVLARLRDLPELRDQRFTSAADLRALSLQIFDRSFLLTYVLELAALLVAIFSVAAGFAGQAMLRRKEFALLSHLGMSAMQRHTAIAIEAVVLLAVGVLWGSALGLLMSQILIHHVNPQSFHWTMDTTLPLIPMVLLAGTVVLVGVGAAVLATLRGLADRSLAGCLREDW
jgi:putative ABC transport system permease protein